MAFAYWGPVGPSVTKLMEFLSANPSHRVGSYLTLIGVESNTAKHPPLRALFQTLNALGYAYQGEGLSGRATWVLLPGTYEFLKRRAREISRLEEEFRKARTCSSCGEEPTPGKFCNHCGAARP